MEERSSSRGMLTPELPTHYHTLPLARRSLTILCEATRLIEGDDAHFCFGDEARDRQQPLIQSVLNSEDSEKDSSISEADDYKSESSGRDSPSPLGLCARGRQLSATAPHASRLPALSEKYPIASTLLNQSPYTSPYTTFRPGVIVHKS
jgi:hypothetical protein